MTHLLLCFFFTLKVSIMISVKPFNILCNTVLIANWILIQTLVESLLTQYIQKKKKWVAIHIVQHRHSNKDRIKK